MKRRSQKQKLLDFVTFPIRALALHGGRDLWGLSSLASERFYYVSEQVQGYCLDVGCGPHNKFLEEFLCGAGKGIDVYKYDGLTEEHIVVNIAQFPFPEREFDSVTFIANLNHVPEKLRDIELAEAHRVLKPGGNIVITMGLPITEILAHNLVAFYDKYFKTNFDLDNIRGMESDEEFFLTETEIRLRLSRAGFIHIRKKKFGTQWGLNQMFMGWKARD